MSDRDIFRLHDQIEKLTGRVAKLEANSLHHETCKVQKLCSCSCRGYVAPTFEQLVAKVGPGPLPMTALASAGEATVPTGWKLAPGWSFGAHGTYDWQCWRGLNDDGEDVGETCKLRGPYLLQEGGSASKGACAAHAEEMQAIVRIEK
jgi:hypothetical protein